jgi:hypothetical protein
MVRGPSSKVALMASIRRCPFEGDGKRQRDQDHAEA